MGEITKAEAEAEHEVMRAEEKRLSHRISDIEDMTKEKIAEYKETLTNLTKRIDEIEDDLVKMQIESKDQWNQLTTKLEALIIKLDNFVNSIAEYKNGTDKTISTLTAKMETMTQAPIKRMELAKNTALTTVIGAVMGALIVGLVQLVAQYIR